MLPKGFSTLMIYLLNKQLFIFRLYEAFNLKMQLHWQMIPRMKGQKPKHVGIVGPIRDEYFYFVEIITPNR